MHNNMTETTRAVRPTKEMRCDKNKIELKFANENDTIEFCSRERKQRQIGPYQSASIILSSFFNYYWRFFIQFESIAKFDARFRESFESQTRALWPLSFVLHHIKICIQKQNFAAIFSRHRATNRTIKWAIFPCAISVFMRHRTTSVDDIDARRAKSAFVALNTAKDCVNKVEAEDVFHARNREMCIITLWSTWTTAVQTESEWNIITHWFRDDYRTEQRTSQDNRFRLAIKTMAEILIFFRLNRFDFLLFLFFDFFSVFALAIPFKLHIRIDFVELFFCLIDARKERELHRQHQIHIVVFRIVD